MAGFRDFLMRFRPVGLPGPPAAGGVPADRSAELAAELEPQLALLQEAEAEARRVREQAVEEAARRREAAERTAADIVDRAQATAQRVREQSAARVHDATATETAALLTAAEHDLAALRERVERRLPVVVDRVVAGVIEGLAAMHDERREGGSSRWAPGG